MRVYSEEDHHNIPLTKHVYLPAEIFENPRPGTKENQSDQDTKKKEEKASTNHQEKSETQQAGQHVSWSFNKYTLKKGDFFQAPHLSKIEGNSQEKDVSNGLDLNKIEEDKVKQVSIISLLKECEQNSEAEVYHPLNI